MGIEARDAYAYTGLHVYVLVTDVIPEPTHAGRNLEAFINELRGMAQDQGPVTSVVEIAGTFKVLVHLRFDDESDPLGPLSELQTFLAGDLWNGVAYELVLEGPAFTGPLNELIGFKKHSCDIVAVVKVWVEHGRSREVLGRLGDELGDRFHGASIVFGGFDILLALEGANVKEVAAAALGALQRIDGIKKTETSFTDWRRISADD